MRKLTERWHELIIFYTISDEIKCIFMLLYLPLQSKTHSYVHVQSLLCYFDFSITSDINHAILNLVKEQQLFLMNTFQNLKWLIWHTGTSFKKLNGQDSSYEVLYKQTLSMFWVRFQSWLLSWYKTSIWVLCFHFNLRTFWSAAVCALQCSKFDEKLFILFM